MGAVLAGRGRADDDTLAPEKAALTEAALTEAAGARPAEGLITEAGFAAAVFLTVVFVAGAFFEGAFFEGALFAGAFFAAVLPAAVALAFIPAFLAGAVAASLGAVLVAAVATAARLAVEADAFDDLPVFAAVVRDLVDTAMVSPESGRQCDDHCASTIASCSSPIGLSNQIGSFSMYIVAIGWLYVVVLMALTESSLVAGLVTLVLWGLAPLALFLWVMGTPERRRRQRSREQPDE
jgi:hypothetical protein